MGVVCCVPGCQNSTARNKGLAFYSVPTDKLLRSQWIAAIEQNRTYMLGKPIDQQKNPRVCAHHFTPGEKSRPNREIPSVFPLPAARRNARRDASKRVYNKQQPKTQQKQKYQQDFLFPSQEEMTVVNNIVRPPFVQSQEAAMVTQKEQLAGSCLQNPSLCIPMVIDLTEFRTHEEPSHKEVETQTANVESNEIRILKKELEDVKRRLMKTEITLQALQDLVASKL